MESVAALDQTMRSVAGVERTDGPRGGLDGRMRSLAELREPMTRLGGIGQTLRGALEAMMSRLANLAGLFDRPALLAVAALFGSFVWSVITVVAVRLAIISASRATAVGASRPAAGG